MSGAGSAIRGSRVGSGSVGEQDKGFKAERVTVNYYCINGHTQSPQFSSTLEIDEIPVELDCPNCGLPAGQDQDNPPQLSKHEPYKTHLAYVKERRTDDEAQELLEEAVAQIRARRAASKED